MLAKLVCCSIKHTICIAIFITLSRFASSGLERGERLGSVVRAHVSRYHVFSASCVLANVALVRLLACSFKFVFVFVFVCLGVTDN